MNELAQACNKRQIFELAGFRTEHTCGVFRIGEKYYLCVIDSKRADFNWYCLPDETIGLLNQNGYTFDDTKQAFVKNGVIAPSFNDAYILRKDIPTPSVRTVHVYTPGPAPVKPAPAPTPTPVPNAAMNKLVDAVTGFVNYDTFNSTRYASGLVPPNNPVATATRDNKGRFDGKVLPPRNKLGRFLPLRDVIIFDYKKDGTVEKRKVVFDDKRSDKGHVRGVDVNKKAYRCFSRAKIVNNPKWTKEYVDLSR